MTTTTPDAVEALHSALSRSSSVDDFSTGAPAEVIKHLNNQGFTITRAEPAPVGFDAAIKQLGEPDEATGHWSLDEGNLRWFVGQCRAKPAMSDAELERELMARAWKEVPMGGAYLLTVDDAMAIAKKYRG